MPSDNIQQPGSLDARREEGLSRKAVHTRRRVRWFQRIDHVLGRAMKSVAAVHEGFWLGCLSTDDRNAVTMSFFERSESYASGEHNRSGLMGWERSAIERYFPRGGRVLVAAAGAGREVLALRLAGYRADGFECSPALVRAGRERFAELGDSLTLCAADGVPQGAADYDALIVGWSAYTHIPSRRRRVRFLKALGARAVKGAPVLLSFFTRQEGSGYDSLVCRTARACRYLTGAPDEVVERGDHLKEHSFWHAFVREELEAELAEAGFLLAHFSEEDYPHAVGMRQ